MFINIFVE